MEERRGDKDRRGKRKKGMERREGNGRGKEKRNEERKEGQSGNERIKKK